MVRTVWALRRRSLLGAWRRRLLSLMGVNFHCGRVLTRLLAL